MSIPVLPPDVNSSFKDFTVIKTEQDQIRFGLLTIKNLGEGVADGLIREREMNGAFKDIEDFVTRLPSKDLNRKAVESLIKCGALDAFGERNILLFNLENLLGHARDRQKNASSGQMGLFGEVEAALPPLRLLEATAASTSEKLMWEKELLGLFVSAHPLSDFQQKLALENVVSIKDVKPHSFNQVRIGGVITQTRKIMTNAGRPMVFSMLEDLTSKIEMIVFPNVLDKYPEAFKENSVVVARGKINDKDGSLKLLCDEVKTIAMLTA
jgi:DNA polymerase-3 subunit alpha